MNGYRKNSFVIDCSVMPARPRVEKIKDFLLSKLHLTMANIKNVQTMLTRSQAIVEVESAELVEQIVSQNLKHNIEYENKEYAIPLFPADNAVEVKIADLPPHMPNHLVAKHFAPYGEILSIKEEAWKEHFPGIPNCVRILRMRLRKAIPSYVVVDGEMSYVTYRNQVRTCRHCVRRLHIGRSCADARKEISRDTIALSSRLTAAQVLAGVMPSQTPTLTQAPVTIPQIPESAPDTAAEMAGPSSSVVKTQLITTNPAKPSPHATAINKTQLTAVNRSSSASRIGKDSQNTAPTKSDLGNLARNFQGRQRTNTSPPCLGFDISDGESESRADVSTKRPGSPQLIQSSESNAKRVIRNKNTSK